MIKANRKKKPSRDGRRRTRRPTTCFKRIRIEALRLDGGTQTRAELNHEAIEDYAAAMADKRTRTMPPIIVYEDTARILWLADGFHRIRAAQKNGQTEIIAEVTVGTRLDALMYSLGANRMHGVRRTNADKHRCVEVALAEKTLRERSSREIADLCGVGHQLVDTIRRELGEGTAVQVDESSNSAPVAKRIGGDGKMYPANHPKSSKKSTPGLSDPTALAEPTQTEGVDDAQTDTKNIQLKDAPTAGIDSFVSGEKTDQEDKQAQTSSKIVAPLKTVVVDALDDEHVATKVDVEAAALQAVDVNTPAQSHSGTDSQVVACAEKSEEVDPFWNNSSPEWADVQRWLSRAHDKLPMDRYTEAERRAFDECFTETARCTIGLGEDICPNHQVKAHIAIHATAALGIILGESLPVSN